MKSNVAALLVGILFSIGLGLSGMTQPVNVFGFLDVFGDWNPALLFVMVGAIAVHGTTYKLIVRRPHPLFALKWHFPEGKTVDRSLIGGSFIFGIGWALAGYCPGPAITSLASFGIRPAIFTACMILGMLAFKRLRASGEPSDRNLR